MASTLSITNLLILSFCALSLSCAKAPPLKKRGKIIKKKVIKIDGGPSSPQSRIGFQEKTARVGLKGVKATHLYAVDWDNDGDTDLVTLPEFYGHPQFFKYQRKSNKFKLVDSPLPRSVRASYLTFADFDKDDKLDVIVGTLNQKTALNNFPLRLFLAEKNEKSEIHFKEVVSAFPKGIYPTASISILDIDMDGWLDIYLGNWFDTNKSPPRPTPDRLFLGREKGRRWIDGSILLEKEHVFSSSSKSFPNAVPTFGTSLCDIDRNGYVDILTASSSGYDNKVWLNLAGSEQRTLVNKADLMKVGSDNEGEYSQTGGGNSFYMLCHDYNNDGLFDMAVGELFHSYDPETRDRSSILTGKSYEVPPQFIRSEYHKDDGSGSWSQGDRRAVWMDFNFDSYSDLLVANSGFPPKSRLVFFEQDSSHGYSDVAKELGLDIVNPSGIIAMDFNRDGRVDIISGQISLRNSAIDVKVFAFENQFPWKKKRLLKLKLKGRRSNKMGIGATVALKTNRGRYVRFVDYSYGPLNSQNEEGLWFGLKEGERPIEVEVRWPYLVKSKRERPYPLRKVYPLKSYKFNRYREIIIKE